MASNAVERMRCLCTEAEIVRQNPEFVSKVACRSDVCQMSYYGSHDNPFCWYCTEENCSLSVLEEWDDRVITPEPTAKPSKHKKREREDSDNETQPTPKKRRRTLLSVGQPSILGEALGRDSTPRHRQTSSPRVTLTPRLASTPRLAPSQGKTSSPRTSQRMQDIRDQEKSGSHSKLRQTLDKLKEARRKKAEDREVASPLARSP